MGMTYLIGEIIALLAVACAIGFVVGWGFRQMIDGGDEGRERELSLQLGRIEAERNELQTRLKRVQASGGAGTDSAAMGGHNSVLVSPAQPSTDSRQMRGEYRVADLPGVNDKALHMMRDVGIRTTYDLLRESEGDSKLRLLSTALEQEPDQVREWRTMADLLRVPGMDGKHARLLVTVGIMSVDALHDREIDDLHAQLASANEQQQLLDTVVDHVTIAGWVSYASPLSQLDLDG